MKPETVEKDINGLDYTDDDLGLIAVVNKLDFSQEK